MLSGVLEEHRRYLADAPRMTAFAKAIGEVVRPGQVVLDLGAGTGILGMLACRAGASRVYAVDRGGIVELAAAICRRNGFGDRIEFIRGMSTEIALPERVNVVLADQIEGLGHEAGLMEYLRDARRRLLKPDGVLIPSRLDLTLVPVEVPEMWEHVSFWSRDQAGFDFRDVRERAVNSNYLVKLHPEQMLGEPVMGCSLDLSVESPPTWTLQATCAVRRPGTLHGIGGWCTAWLSRGVLMTSSPLASDRIDRMHAFFPTDPAVAVQEGDTIRVSVRIMTTDLITWCVEVRGGAADSTDREGLKARCTQSTFKGMFLSKEEVRQTAPEFVPRLSAAGEARREVLTLCDGRRDLAQIGEEIYRRHADLFGSVDDASSFVARIVSRHAA